MPDVAVVHLATCGFSFCFVIENLESCAVMDSSPESSRFPNLGGSSLAGSFGGAGACST